MEIFKTFDFLEDPRCGENITYQLRDILAITFCAVIAGADNWNEVQDYANANKVFLLQHFNISKVPSHDTFRRIFLLLPHKKFQNIFLAWAIEIMNKHPDIIHLDGKTSRRSFDNKNSIPAVHILNAYVSSQSLVIAQMKTGIKTNEISSIKHILADLNISGAVITIDAIGTQKKIAKLIVEKNGEYILSVKDNQKIVHDGLKNTFSAGLIDHMLGFDRYEDNEIKTHGRSEKRSIKKMKVNNRIMKKLKLDEWKNCKSIIEIKRERLLNGKLSIEYQYYISSLKKKSIDFGKMIRKHWNIENKLHWVLDILFREDECRKRAGDSAANFSLIRKIALNILVQKKGYSLRRKRKLAGWSNEFLLSLLQS
jgi:predicted transposase YbfD/YdcC